MPVDDRDDASAGSSSEDPKKKSIPEALQSQTDEPLPPAVERAAERDADRPEPVTPQGQRRRWLTRRHAFIATLVVAAGLFLLIIAVITIYKLGFIDRYIANQIKDTMAQYGIRADIKYFHTAFSPRTVEMRDIELYDAQTGQHLGKIDRMLATVRVEDLYAIRLQRNVNLESLVVDSPEVWVNFDAQGNSNFHNLHLPPPEPNQRILFSYSTALIKINGGVVHYGDAQHDLSGEARNLALNIQPDDPNAPAESWMNTVTFSSTNSTLTYDGRPAINNIDLNAHGRINQTRAEIQDVTLRSPLAEAHLQGTMDDWRNLRYQMQANATVDLTQASDVLQAGTTLRGAGAFVGTVSGEGSRYQVDGNIKSDALAADGLRLRALNVNARGSVDGKSYDMNGKAVAELLTAGDFQLNVIQLAGGVMGTGTDFRFLGDLRSAAARYAGTTSITNLILSDVAAESRENTLTARIARVFAGGLNTSRASLNSVQASDVRLRSENGVKSGSAGSVQAGTLTASGARVNGLAANGVDFNDRNGTTNVTANSLRVNGINAAGAQVGTLNIAGVKLAIHDGRVQGSTQDFNAGTVSVAQNRSFPGGRIENVRVAHPVFTLEPSGSYRASADLSLGGGVLGQVNLGAAHAAVVATNSQVQLNNFTADVMGGRASGNATVSLARGGASRVTSEFSDLDIGKLVSLLSGRAMLVAGKATGTVDLAFPGTDVSAASGTARVNFNAETGDETSGRTPLTGTLDLRANRGLFNIDRASLRTAASELNASGQFSFTTPDSNLQLSLNSTDAAELQRLLASSGLLPNVEEQLGNYGIALAGKLTFNGTLSGRLEAPSVNGRASLDSLIVNGQEVGALSATLNSTPTEFRVTDGKLTQREGGGAQFTLNAPVNGSNNITLDAALDRVNGQTLVTVVSGLGVIGGARGAPGSTTLSSINLHSDLSGHINVAGLPNAMSGNADLRFGAGSLNGESFESIVARATFNGSNVNLETVDARFNAGHITANGTFDTTTKAFDLQARGQNIQLDRLTIFTGGAGAVPQLAGTADLNARATGIFTDFSSYQINFEGTGRDVMVNGKPAGTLSLMGRTENKQLNVAFTTGLLGQPQVVNARIDLSNEQLPTTIETTLTNVDLTPLFATLMPDANVKVIGRATGTLRASGNLFAENEQGENVFGVGGLRGRAEFSDLTVQIEEIPLTAVSPLQVQFSTSEIFFEKTEFKGPDTDIVFGGTAALGTGGKQNLTIDGKLNLRVLNSFSPNVFSSGTAEAAVRVSGTYEQPRITGTASVAGASVSTLVGSERLTLSNVKGRVIFNSNQAQIESLTANLGGGQVSASGGVLLQGFALSRFLLNVRANDVVVPFPANFRSTADADLEVKGTQRQQIISGTVNLRRAEYTQNIEIADIINRHREASLTEGGGDSTFGSATIFDRLRVVGRDALVVRNNLADMVGSVSLELNGPVEDPIISGRITATRGTLSFRNDRYELTRAYIDLPGQRNADPLLNVQAESEIRGYRVIVQLTGPLSQPQAIVRSDPSLPQADVVSLITTGDLSTGETSGSALAQSGLGTATSLLTDTLINAPAQRATNKLFGLTRFEIDPLIAGRGGASPTARLTVGRQITRNLSITYSTNLTSQQNQVLALEYRVSNRLSFVAQYQQGSVGGFQSRNDNFSFEIRFHKRF